MTQLTFGAVLCRHCRTGVTTDPDAICNVCRGISLRDQGFHNVESATPAAWIAAATLFVTRLPAGTEFTAEDLTAALGRPPRPNAEAERAERHASRMLVWVRR